MLIRDRFDIGRIRKFALEHLIAIHYASLDPRGASVALTARALTGLWRFASARFAVAIRDVARRIAALASFVTTLPPADTTVAAGGR
jgi:hypothetical protein